MKTRLIVFAFMAMLVIAASCQNDGQIEFNRFYSNGSVVYQAHCQNCHGAKGEGLQGLIPSLTDSIYLKNNKNTLACQLNSGLKGKITILNKEFEGEMPASKLSPLEIAQVLTYVTNSFGNKLGTINTDRVNTDLAKCK
ncbi:cytochrome c [Mucilaginibacter sp.]|uniref:c-type cytochrome n=1 Tax=Mucilaginibacter sp. TaxID=1882438 RepID=UPI0025D7BFEB|nr:cytochrome c [Mucilaginibacter sp.]